MAENHDPPPPLTLADFVAHVGTTFRFVAPEASPFEATLVEARDESRPDGRHGPPGGRAPFSLLFRPLDGAMKPQTTYAIEADGAGPHLVFCVPVLGEDATPHLEAGFN